MTYFTLAAIGLVAGVLAGMFGIGGGLVIVPALMFLIGFHKDQAVATSLAALIPPVGLLGAAEYYRRGAINLAYAGIIAAGIFAGAYFGARITLALPEAMFRRIYAGFLLFIGFRMLIMGK
jgi:uncharacterized membrane protein YfcA